MTTLSQEREPVSSIEVHGCSFESRAVMLSRLHKVLLSSGCWMVGYKRCSGATEYRFEIELAAALELYSGLMHAGLQMTELTHRTLTQLCMLHAHGQMMNSQPRILSVRLVMTFFRFEDEPVELIGTSARGC